MGQTQVVSSNLVSKNLLERINDIKKRNKRANVLKWITIFNLQKLRKERLVDQRLRESVLIQ